MKHRPLVGVLTIKLISMKTNPCLAIVALVAVAVVGNISAQTPSEPPPSPVAQPEANHGAVSPPLNQIVYGSQLPTAQDLSNAASAQGLTIDRIEQTATQVTVVYKTQNGLTSTVSYQLVPRATSATSTLVLPTTPAPAIIYSEPPRVVYRYDPYYAYDPFYYSPWYSYPRISLGFGFGYGFRGAYHRGGYYRGGYVHGRSFYGRSFHGGFHRSR